MTKIQGFNLVAAAIALGLAGNASAETSGIVSSAVVSKEAGVSAAPAVVKAKTARETKVVKPLAETGKRSVASSTAREGTSDPYAVPLFKDARQLR